MSGVESFFGNEGLNQSFNAEQYAEFKARMAASAAQVAAMQAGEQKQKKKEEDLAKILLAFIKSGGKTEIIKLVVKLLELNLPAAFIISLILINHPEIQQQTGLKLLMGQNISTNDQSVNNQNLAENPTPISSANKNFEQSNSSSNTLPDLYFKNYTLPLEVKIAIDSWIQEIAKISENHLARLLLLGIDINGNIKTDILQLPALCLAEFLMDKNLDHDLHQVYLFTEIFMKGIFQKLKELEPKKLN